MNIRVDQQSQPEILNEALKSTQGVTTGRSSASSSAAQSQDTASISAASSQLSGEDGIRQEHVDALRSQMESGTYTVNPHAVATAMFNNLFRS
jgi:flagellar biosynthesis anti-sigma factor FlgM